MAINKGAETQQQQSRDEGEVRDLVTYHLEHTSLNYLLIVFA